MTTLKFLSDLRKLKINIYTTDCADGRLKIDAPAGVLTPELKAELIARKDEILAFLQATQAASGDTSLAVIRPVPRDEPLPISFSQERLWFLDKLEPGNFIYNIPGAIRLKGNLDIPEFEHALNQVLIRHEALRTNFTMVGNQPVQVIRRDKTLPLPITDVSGLDLVRQEEEINRLIDMEARHSFDLTQDLLIRTTLIKVSDREHIFTFNAHHIISDAWSMGVFVKDLATFYTASINQKPANLPPLPIQYADFSHWQRQWLQGDRLNNQLNYWKQQLAGTLPSLDLLLDYPRPPAQSFHSRREMLDIPVELAQRLRQLSQTAGTTLFMTLLAAFKLLLHRYTGLEDIVVGTPIAGRNRSETENQIGFFLNSLVLRTDLSGSITFQDLLKRVLAVTTDAFANQDVPFEKLLAELRPERHLSQSPLFQVFFNMINFVDTQLELPGLTMEPANVPDIGSKFDLTLYVTEYKTSIRLALVYSTDLFNPERMADMLAQYRLVLDQVVENPNRTLGEYSLITEAAELALPDPQAALDETWHGAIHTRLTEIARQQPNHPAIIDSHRTWSYAELEAYSNRLAHFLREHGVGAQDGVAVYAHRSAALVWAILGIFKAGGAFLIIDPAYPVARQLNYLEAANVKGFIQIEAAGILPPEMERLVEQNYAGCRLMLPPVPCDQTFFSQMPSSPPAVYVDADDLAYIAFTSGSTGIPKGILGRHGPLSHFLPWQQQEFSLSQRDRFSMLSGLAHDPLQRDIFTALWVGATICIPDSAQIGAPGWLARWMGEMQVTFAHFTPAMAQLLSKSTAIEAGTSPQLTALRTAFFVGDKLTRNDVLNLRRIAPKVTCINSYGSTETQRAVGYLMLDANQCLCDTPGKETIPVGQGVKDAQLLVLNQAQQLAGVGELGEIYLRSPHLSKGYLNDTQLTRQKFITNPFTGNSTDRLYKSGDLGRYLIDGKVEFLGRNDKQVKIRGFRIEPGEIESTLSRHRQVKQVVISRFTQENSESGLAAYIVVDDNPQPPTATELRTFLQEHLPDYMIPARFILLAELPLTPNGKIDYDALPAPDLPPLDSEQTYLAPRNEVETALAQIWQEVLGMNSISVNDNFFELGGHSLLAVHLFSLIDQRLGTNLPLATLFQNATIAHLAEIISKQKEPQTWSSLIEVEKQGAAPPFFCIHGITGDILWFKDLARSLAPNYPFYGIQARGLDGRQPPFDDIQAMAAYYLEEIRRVQPTGPYYFGGASFGGTVALEMAQQLLANGESVALLAIFDHSPPNVGIQESQWNQSLVLIKIIKNFPYWLSESLKLGPTRLWARFLRKTRLIGKRLSRANHILGEATDLIDYANELPDYRRELISSHYKIIRKYTPQSYSGQVTLFRAKSRPLFNPYDPEIGWQQLSPGNVDVRDVPGSHEGMFRKPNVDYLAQQLRNCFDQAQQRAAGSEISN